MNHLDALASAGRRVISRSRTTVVVALAVALLSSGTAAAASYLVLSTTNSASTTTTLRSAVNGAVLSIQNTNSAGGTSARGLSITVPAGRAPITVSSTAGKATNLNADKLDGVDSTGFVRKTSTGWHEIGTAGQPAFLCNLGFCPLWQNYGSGYNTAAFMKDDLGFVHLKGLIKDIGVSSILPCHSWAFFALPAGYRPTAIVIGTTLRNDQPQRVDVLPTGEVTICAPEAFAIGDWFSLDGITFKAG